MQILAHLENILKGKYSRPDHALLLCVLESH